MTIARAARDLGVSGPVLRRWVKELEADQQQAFPGHGQQKADQAELTRLRREVAKLKAERDILVAGLLGEGQSVKFAFVAKHRGIWPAGWMCGALGGLAGGGFYAWLTRPPSSSLSERRGIVGHRFGRASSASDRTTMVRSRIWRDVLADDVSRGLASSIERLMRQQALLGTAADAAPPAV